MRRRSRRTGRCLVSLGRCGRVREESGERLETRAGFDALYQQAPGAGKAGDVHGNRTADHDPTP